MTVENKKPKPVRNKWLPYTFDLVPVKLAPFDLSPISDIPIRLVIEQGVISRKRDLALYRLQEDWNGHPKNSIVIAGPIEEGQPFAVWIGDNHYQKMGDEEESEPIQTESKATQSPTIDSYTKHLPEYSAKPRIIRAFKPLFLRQQRQILESKNAHKKGLFLFPSIHPTHRSTQRDCKKKSPFFLLKKKKMGRG